MWPVQWGERYLLIYLYLEYHENTNFTHHPFTGCEQMDLGRKQGVIKQNNNRNTGFMEDFFVVELYQA